MSESTPPPPNRPAADAPGVSPPPAQSPPQPVFDRTFVMRLGVRVAAFLVAGILLLTTLGLLQRAGWLGADAGRSTAVDAPSGTIFTCPMHPQIRQPRPGRCPICSMPLEPIASVGDAAKDQYAVRIEPAARRLANIHTAAVEQRPVTRLIESIGRLAIDESRQAAIAAYVSGRIERLFADYTGVVVERGDHLAVLYSPQLYAAQVEYLESRRTLANMSSAGLAPIRTSQERLVAAARHRLTELGMTDEQLAHLEESGEARSRLTIFAPIGGTVIEKLVVGGQYVEAGEPIYRIANLDTVWLLLQLFPEDAALMRFGQRVEVEVQSLPGRPFTGRVAFVNPIVDERTRTVDVRVELANDDRLLRPGDYARARVAVPLGEQGEVYDADLAGKWISPMHPQIIRDEPGNCPICDMALVPTSRYGFVASPAPQPEVLVVPRSAVLVTGSTSLVYVETEPGRFEIRPVKLGPLLRDEAVIVAGVAAGEQVALSGNFLIDSQMQLAGKPSLIDPRRAMARPPSARGPLSLPPGPPQEIVGEAGQALEQLYQAYFALVATLAGDKPPAEAEVTRFVRLADQLAKGEALPPELRERLTAISKDSAHLHHQSLEQTRQQFKSISSHILHLAVAARGEHATSPLIHNYCSMVADGKGDWLQGADPPANPYWGSKMLRCVQHQERLPLPGDMSREPPAPSAERN